MNLYRELAEYTGESTDYLKRICPKAAFGLVWEWHTKKDVLDFYRTTDLYLYDLTHYQQDSLGEKFYGNYKVSGNGLDLGGGIGEYTIQAIKQGCEMDYVDVDGKTMDYAKWRFRKHNVEPKIHTEEFKIDKDYDFVVAMDVFEHLENPQERIEEIAQHTKLLIANPDQVRYNDLYPMHISLYDLTPYFEQHGCLWYKK